MEQPTKKRKKNPNSSTNLQAKVNKAVGVALRKSEELHYNVYSLVPTAVSNAGSVTDMLIPSQGPLDTDRIGDKIYLHSFEGTIWAIAGAANSTVRIMFFQWHGIDVPVVTSLLTSTLVGTSNAAIAQYAYDTSSQYNVLWDRVYALNLADSSNKVAKFSTKKLRKNVQFLQSSTVGSNKIYCLMISSNGSNMPTVGYTVKVRWSDC